MRLRLLLIPTAFTLALGVMATQPAAAQSDDALVGDWEGTMDAGPQGMLPIVFHVTRAEDGTLSATMDSPAQSAFGIPMTSASLDGSDVTLELTAAQARYSGTLSEDGTAIEGTWTQGPASLPLNLTKSEGGAASAAPDRPQEPELPLPYRSEEVSVPNAPAGIHLAGTLTLPDGDGPFPAVILVSGSGPQNRDEALMGHRPFYVLSDHLTRQGIAVLRYDDRGVGESEGNFAIANSHDFASDAQAAVEFLRRHPDIDGNAVGIIGHSEGGMIAPMVAADEPDKVAFIIMMAGPGTTGAEILVAQGQLIARAMGTPEEMIALNTNTQTRMIETVMAEPDPEVAAEQLRGILGEAIATLPAEVQEQAGQNAEVEIAQINSPWFRFFLSYDPRPTLERVTVPVLAINGEKDLQVPWKDNLDAIEAALDIAGNDDATVQMLPGLNHLFQTADLGTPAEYAQITETISPQALELMSSWILERFGGAH